MKSIPIWNRGNTTGTGWSSGAASVILRLFRWHTSQFATYTVRKIVVKESQSYNYIIMYLQDY